MAGPTILSLFSGIGGLELACRIVFPRARTLGYVERDGYAAASLLARMEDEALEPAPVWCDSIENLDCRELEGRIDLVTAGFPCTDVSQAGKRVGIEGDATGLWTQVVRIIGEVRPDLVFLENVAAIRSARGRSMGGPTIGSVRALGVVLGDLAALGFDAEWLCLRASDVGAPHQRDRWFCLAYRNQSGREVEQFRKLHHGQWTTPWDDSHPCDPTVAERRRERPQGIAPGGPAPRTTGRGSGDAVAHAADDHWRRGKHGTEAGTREDGERERGPAVGGDTMADPELLQSEQSERIWTGPGGAPGAGSSDQPSRPSVSLADPTIGSPRLAGSAHQPRGPRRARAAGADVADPGDGLLPQPERGPQGRDGAGSAGQDVGDPGDRSVGREPVPDPERDGVRNESERGRGSARAPERGDSVALDLGAFPPGPADIDYWRDILAADPWLAPAVESGVRRVVDGVSHRVDASRADRLRCLGNAVVPLQAAVALAELLRRVGEP